MKIAMIAVALAATVGHALAWPEHDAKLEAAAARIVAGRMGPLRGGFDIGQTPELVRAIVRHDSTAG